MPNAYSQELGDRVIDAVEMDGTSRRRDGLGLASPLPSNGWSVWNSMDSTNRSDTADIGLPS